MVPNRDMVVHKKIIADWKLIYSRRREQQIKNNMKENKSRTNYKWKVGDYVRIITKVNERTGKLLGFEHQGPYRIKIVHGNGTVDIECGNFVETINIRRLKRVRTPMENKE